MHGMCNRCRKHESVVRYIGKEVVCPKCHTDEELKKLMEAVETLRKLSNEWRGIWKS